MEDTYEKLWMNVKDNKILHQWNIVKMVIDFFDDENSNDVELPIDITQTINSAEELQSFFRLVILYTKVAESPMAFDWSSDNAGTFFIKSLLALGKYWKFWEIISKEAMPLLHALFTLPEQRASLPDIAYLYSMTDFKVMNKKILDQKIEERYGSRTNLPELYSPSILKCIQDMAEMIEKETERTYFEETVEVEKSSVSPAPCKEPNNTFPSCQEYCNWHKKFFKIISKAEFLTMMKYALPQRRQKLDHYGSEDQRLAKKIFKGSNVKTNLNYNMSSMTMMAFHHSRLKGFTGDKFETSDAILDIGFFPTPTNKGICLSRYLDINGIMKVNEDYSPILQPNVQKVNEKVEVGTSRSQLTLVFLPESSEEVEVGKPFKQAFPRSSTAKIDELELQLHDPKELADFLHTDLPPITLKGGYEYFIDVNHHVRKSEDGFKSLNLGQRNCLLEEENKDESSIFKTYKESNCKYECYVKLASEQCQCIPWDFMHNKEKVEECDVFGRTCFYKAMKNPKDQIGALCPKCWNDCDFIRYKKYTSRKRSLMVSGRFTPSSPSYYENDGYGKCRGSKNFCEFLLDSNATFIEKGVKNFMNTIAGNDIYHDERALYPGLYSNLIILHLIFNEPEVDKVDTKYSELDYFASFGGNFGIFVEMTGCSFLGVLNFCILMVKLCCSFSKGKGATKENLPN